MKADVASTLGLWRSLLIYRGQPWRTLALRRFCRTLVRPGDLAFDVGAHVGSRARALAAAGARVVAIEPQPLFADYLARRVAGPRIAVLPVALGRTPGRATLNVSRRHPTVSTLSADWIGKVREAPGFSGVRWEGRTEVPVTTLDALIAEHGRPAFCKIDVEGLEAEILGGLSQPIPLLCFEILPAAADIAEACIRRLAGLGPYRFGFVPGERHRLGDEWLSADRMVARLPDIAAAGRSGDIYARLQ
ncbi:FkbM family methyltransferase [Antarcticirhabdus aurantiaca]|uniref:FkbM family methyltransferase n=1 Tax=Antarcticirhabdus aurantiaca TaxID=2606717 RepID=A0ACD4NH81_9HYPH|nr:FkbM family methyltransferase [Antarcticirhabdus aurantiaca]WAJ26172.1 FkbM family methyltransferase [Jeongeuplla avenae]